jgi:hypothetical protein
VLLRCQQVVFQPFVVTISVSEGRQRSRMIVQVDAATLLLLRGRALRVGHRVSVEGVAVHTVSEGHYRDARWRSVLHASCLKRGLASDFRVIATLLFFGLAALGACLVTMMWIGPDTLEKRTRALHHCPPKTTQQTIPYFEKMISNYDVFTEIPRGWQHACLDSDETYHGPYHRYRESGSLAEIRNYAAGSLDGPQLSFGKDGQLAQITTYRNGHRRGLQIGFSAAGFLCQNEYGRVRHGSLVCLSRGALVVGQYRRDQADGLWISFALKSWRPCRDGVCQERGPLLLLFETFDAGARKSASWVDASGRWRSL